MRDYIEIGCTPTEEDCFPVGHPLAKKECYIYKAQLERAYPGVEFQVRANRHDFGTYHEVAAYYSTEDESSKALDAECGCDHWDKEAKVAHKQMVAEHEKTQKELSERYAANIQAQQSSMEWATKAVHA